ncbi:MAG TPA: YfhO family protein [Candidatus Sumerlaeia bacterium]|nr:YfhO family protein [Candidatus Sumerlaeia bacterium]
MNFEKREFFAVAGVFLLLWLVFCIPLIVGGQVLSGGDLINQYIPYKQFFKDWVWKGVFPLWNPHIFSGRPFQADIQNGLFYPPNWLCLIMPLPIFFTIITILHLWFVSLGAYLLCTRWLRHKAARFLFAFIYSFNSFFTARLYSGVVLFILTAAWTPWILYYAEDWFERREKKTPAMLGLLMALQLLAGSPQVAFYTWLMMAVLFILQWLQKEKRAGLLTGYAAAGILMVGLTALQFMPMKEFIERSYERAHGAGWEYITDGSLQPRALATFLAPNFFGTQRREDIYWGNLGFWEYNGYIGIAPLFLAGLFLILRRQVGGGVDERVRQTRRRWNRLSLILLIAWATLATGKYSPIFKFFYLFFPGFNRFRVPGRMVIFYLTAICYLSSLSLDMIIQTLKNADGEASAIMRRGLRFSAIAAFCLFILCVLCLIAPLPFMKLLGIKAIVSPKILNALTGPVQEMMAASRRSILIFAASLILAWGAVAALLRRKAKPRDACWILALCAVDLFYFGMPLIEAVPWRMFYEKIYPDTQLSRFISDAAKQHQRIAWTDSLMDWMNDQNQPELYPNRGMMKGILDIRGYDPIYIGKYGEFFNAISRYHEPKSPGAFLRLIQIFNPHLLSALNVRYLLSYEKYEFPGWELKKSFTFGLQIYENQNPLGSAYLAESFPIGENEWHLIPTTLENPNFPIANRAMTQGGNPNLAENKKAAGQKESVKLLSYTPNRREYKVKVGGSDILVFSEAYYPGWRAAINGADALPHIANHALWGVFIPPGRHKVVCYFRPWSFVIGGIVSSLMLIGLILFFILEKWKKRNIITQP